MRAEPAGGRRKPARPGGGKEDHLAITPAGAAGPGREGLAADEQAEGSKGCPAGRAVIR